MIIILEVSSWFRKYTGGQSIVEVELAEGSTAAEVISAVGIPDEDAGLVVLNNKKIDSGFILSDGDRIKLFPYIIGG